MERDIRDIIRGFIVEELPIKESLIDVDKRIEVEWDSLLHSTLNDLFHDVGVADVDAVRDERNSRIEVVLDNGDRIVGATTANPLSGVVTINDDAKKQLNGPDAMRLISSMRDFWEKYSHNAAKA